jgi:hypothetical protein
LVCAKIPIKHRQDSVKKLEQLFGEWKGLKKNKNRQTQTQQTNEASFSEVVAQLFDIAHADAMTLIENEEDKLFLESQRQKGRPGCMMGVDKVLLQQQQKQKEKYEKLQRRQRSLLEKAALSETVVLESSSSNNSGNSSAKSDDEDPMPSTSTAAPPPRKRGRHQIISAPLAAMLDRNLLSDRAAMMVVFESLKAVGQDPENFALNRSTIQRQRQKHVKQKPMALKKHSTQTQL